MAQPAAAPLVAARTLPGRGPVRRSWDSVPLVVRYGLAGLVTQVVYLSALGAALALQWHYLLAMGVAQLFAIAFAFPTYRAQVFRSDGPVLPQLMKFLGIWWAGLAISFIGVPLLVEGLHLSPFPAQLAMLVVVVTASFLSHRGITFRVGGGAGARAVDASPASSKDGS